MGKAEEEGKHGTQGVSIHTSGWQREIEMN
jgi:hypothetical protein